MGEAFILVTRLSLLIGLLALAPPGELLAQEDQAERIDVGDRVRLRAPRLYARPLVGDVAALRTDTLVLAVKGSRTVPLPIASITELEKSLGTRGMGVKGALLGGVVGGALGAAFLRSGGGPAANLAIPIGAFVGFVAGGLITGPSEEWVDVPVEALRTGGHSSVSVRLRL